MQLADDLSGLELHPREVVCQAPDCHLVHWGPAGSSACDRT